MVFGQLLEGGKDSGNVRFMAKTIYPSVLSEVIYKNDIKSELIKKIRLEQDPKHRYK